jgi:hypothetical protein
MKVLVATPAYGGMVLTRYVVSLIESFQGAARDGIEMELYTISNESYVGRGRNRIAMYAIEHGFDRVFFVDGDIGWEWAQMLALIRSDKRLVAGTYPLKRLPLALNYNVLPEHAAYYRNRPEDHARLKQYADESGDLEVKHVPAGFMSIETTIFAELAKVLPAYKDSGSIGYDFFPVGERNGFLESEDWGFCSLCREHGISVYLNMNIVVDHTGTYTFDINAQLI